MLRIKENKKWILLILLLFVIQIIVYVFFGMQKIDYHTDEYNTYLLANHAPDPWWSIPQDQWVTTEETMLTKMLVDSEDEKFQYAAILKKQSLDLHPFLYSWTVNTICSIWPGTDLSQWQGLTVNFIAAIGITVLAFITSLMLQKDKIIALLTAVAVVFSYGVVDMIMFIRMYTQLMFWGLALFSIHLVFWNQQKPLFYILLFVISVCGTLTQYHFLIILFFSCLYFGIRLIGKRKSKNAILYLVTEIIAGCFVIALFPPILSQLFEPHNSTAIRDNGSLLSRISEYVEIANTNIFNGWMAFFAVLCFVLIISFFYAKVTCRKNTFLLIRQENYWGKICFCCVSPSMFFVFLGFTAPYYAARYVAILFPILITIAVSITSQTFLMLVRHKTIALVLTIVCFSMVTIHPYTESPLTNLYKDRIPIHENAEKNSEKPVVIVSEYDWLVPYNYSELSEYGKYIRVTTESLSKDSVQSLLPKEDFMLYVYDFSSDYESVLQEALPFLKQYYGKISLNEGWTTRCAKVFDCKI